MQKQVHDNSVATFHSINRVNRSEEILRVYRDRYPDSLTDRDVKTILEFSDMNSVRPRITEMVKAGDLKETGTVIDRTTKKPTRTVRWVTDQERTSKQGELF